MTNFIAIITISTNLIVSGNSYDPIKAQSALDFGMLDHSNKFAFAENQIKEFRVICEKAKASIGIK